MKLRLKLLSLQGLLVLNLGLALTLTGPGCASKSSRAGGGASISNDVLPLVGDKKVHRFILPNLLKLLVVEDHSSPTFAYHTWFRVGSRDEVTGRTGLAHLFEHMMFKETKNFKEGQFFKLSELEGAEGQNAFTNKDYTAYIQEFSKDKLDLIAHLESDRMVNLLVNDNSFKTEREVVQNERRFRTENNPDGQLWQEVFEVAYEKHPYHWPVIGYAQDLIDMTSEDARNFYKAHYSPDHAIVIVVGDVDPNDVLGTIKKYYGEIAPSHTPESQPTPEPPQTTPRRKKLLLNVQVEKMLVAYHIPEATQADIPALDVAQAILGMGKSSRLQRALVDTGIAQSVGMETIEAKDPSLVVIAVNLQKGKKATQAETVILREIARLTKEPVSAKELERAKNKINFGFYEELNSNSEVARFIGQYETTTGGFEAGLKIYENMQKVTPEEIQTVIKRYLDPKGRTVIKGQPK